jgi:Ser/Thr protein kinase RdoA (MazF antagonist)
VVRYKPGSRCTILYDMDYGPHQGPDSNWPDLVVAKTYRSEKGQNAYESMRALWDSPLASSGAVTIAEPLAYNPELRVLLQGPIREEQTLKNLITWAAFTNSTEALSIADDSMRKTAYGLAALHRSGIRYGRLWTWEDELAEVRERIDRLAEPIPGIGQAADPLLERLTEMAGAVPPDPLVPSHGSFRPAQVLLYQGQIGFIDFDSFCQSEPALDLALFLSTVKSLGLDTSEFEGEKSAPPLEGTALAKRLEQMLALSERFLDEYERSLPVSRQRVALWEALDLTMLILASWIKVKTFRLQDCIFLLENHLRRMGI